jgi:hypothetical protein
MNGKFFLISLLLAGMCLAARAQQVPAFQPPRLFIPKISQPPVIDGTLDPAEWRESVAVSGTGDMGDNGNLQPRPTTFYLAWDAGHLYLGARVWVMPNYKPHVSGREPGLANVYEDTLELGVKPLGHNVASSKLDASYKFFINCLGFGGDYMRNAVGQLFRDWKPQFHTAVRLTPPGSAPDGGRWWECEIAATTQDFELTGSNQPGDEWRFLLGFDHMPIWHQAAIPITSGYFDPAGWVRATLAEQTPAVQVLMEQPAAAQRGQAAVTVKVYNPTTQPKALRVTAQYDALGQGGNEAANTLFTKSQVLTVAPGQTAEAVIDAPLAATLGDRRGQIYFQVADGETELYRYTANFTAIVSDDYLRAAPTRQAFPLSATLNPARDNVLIEVDSYYLEDPTLAKSATYRITRQGEQQPLASGVMN